MKADIKPTGRVVIAGGTGFIGTNLARHLAGLGCEVVLISRNVPKKEGPWTHVKWDGRTVGGWTEHLDGASAVVNLAGRTVDCIKTPDHCDEILRSRMEATLVLGEAVRGLKTPPPVWVQMATAHIYGDPPEAVCDEDSAFGFGLAPIVGKAWEAAFAEAVLPKMRQVILRTSFVLGANGGAFPKMRMLARCCLGGRAGHGRQGISWLHIDDMTLLIVRAIADETMAGVYVATAPKPVSQAEFMRELRRAIRMPIAFPATELMVRFGAHWLLRTDPELVLCGRYCISRRLEEEGHEFAFENIKDAMVDLCR